LRPGSRANERLELPNDPVAAGQMWVRGMRAYARVSLPRERLLVVRLEDLVSDPPGWIGQMSAHLRVSTHPDMLAFGERAEEISQQNKHPDAHAGLSRPLSATRVWSDELSARDAARIWCLVEPFATQYGYTGPDTPLPRVPSAEAAVRLAGFQLARSWRRAWTLTRLVRR